MTISIIGGGSLGHVCAGIFSSNGNKVNIFSQHPDSWERTINVIDLNNKLYEGCINKVSSDPGDVISNSDIVFLCLPGFLIKQSLQSIKPYISNKTIIGSIVSSTGFFFFAHEVLPKETPLFGFQRTPFIARVAEYGKSANLLGYKNEVAIACENIENVESFRSFIENLFITPTKLLNSFYEASLTNSNPILHTGRLYTMWKDWDGTPYDHNILFYKEWNDEASECIIEMDNEFMQLLSILPINKSNIPPLLEYYESSDANSLTRKISSIPAFQTIKSPMKQIENGWIPDFESRYFTEDFPFGLKIIKDLAIQYGLHTPTIDEVYKWGNKVIHSNY